MLVTLTRRSGPPVCSEVVSVCRYNPLRGLSISLGCPYLLTRNANLPSTVQRKPACSLIRYRPRRFPVPPSSSDFSPEVCGSFRWEVFPPFYINSLSTALIQNWSMLVVGGVTLSWPTDFSFASVQSSFRWQYKTKWVIWLQEKDFYGEYKNPIVHEECVWINLNIISVWDTEGKNQIEEFSYT